MGIFVGARLKIRIKIGLMVSALLIITLVLIIFYHGQLPKVPASPCEASGGLFDKPPQCIKAGALSLPDATNPVRGAFFGFSPGYGMVDALAIIAKSLDENAEKITLNILYAANDEVDATQAELGDLQKVVKADRLNLIATSEKEAVWAQDFMLTAWDSGKQQPVIIDLPYRTDEGDKAPSDIAQACHLPLVAAPSQQGERHLSGVNGSYGGNIEGLAGATLLVGNNTPRVTQEFLADLTQAKNLQVKADWLSTGHVDEFLQLVPNLKKNRKDCGVAIIAASPKLALNHAETIQATSQNTHLSFQPFIGCGAEIKKTPRSEACEELLKANLTYQVMIDRSVKTAAAAIQETYGCEDVTVAQLPVLFYPDMFLDEYGQKMDQAKSAFPNPVNGISLNSVYIAPRQPHGDLETMITKSLGAIGLHAVFINGDNLHKLGGGLHCWSQTIRRCG